MTNAQDTAGSMPTEFSIPEEVVGRSLGEDLIVHRFDTDEVFVLNADARVIFEAIQRGGDREGAWSRVTELGFDGESAAAAFDQLIADMLAHGIIVTRP